MASFPLLSLPDHLLCQTFSHLAHNDRVSVMLVNKRFCFLARCPESGPLSVSLPCQGASISQRTLHFRLTIPPAVTKQFGDTIAQLHVHVALIVKELEGHGRRKRDTAYSLVVEALQALPHCRTLHLIGTSFCDARGAFLGSLLQTAHQSTTRLILSGGVSGDVSACALSNYPNLRHLEVKGHVSLLPYPSLENIPNIAATNLTCLAAQIHKLSAPLLQRLPHLVRLDGVRLAGEVFPALTHCINLRDVSVVFTSNDECVSLAPLESCSKLSRLHVRSWPGRTKFVDFPPLPSLTDLSASRNVYFESWDWLGSSSLTALTRLDLFVLLPPDTDFPALNCPNLIRVSLTSGCINNILSSLDFLDGCVRLRFLELSRFQFGRNVTLARSLDHLAIMHVGQPPSFVWSCKCDVLVVSFTGSTLLRKRRGGGGNHAPAIPRRLVLDHCFAVTNIAGLAKSANLEEFVVRRDGGVIDLRPLGSCPNLRLVELSGGWRAAFSGRQCSLEPLDACLALDTVILNGWEWSHDLGPLGRCSSLTSIALKECSPGVDLSPIANAPRLRALHLQSYYDDAWDLRPLESCPVLDPNLVRFDGPPRLLAHGKALVAKLVKRRQRESRLQRASEAAAAARAKKTQTVAVPSRKQPGRKAKRTDAVE